MDMIDKWSTVERFIENGRMLSKDQIIYLLNREEVLDLVNCSECKHFTQYKHSNLGYCPFSVELVTPGHYCGKGERA